MKTIKYFALLLIATASLSSCVVREHRGGYYHHNYGYNSGRYYR
jgi:hypothetical protein